MPRPRNVVAGVGWITGGEYGCVRRRVRRSYAEIGSLRSELLDQSIFSYPVKGFARYDRVSRTTCCAVALALHDAGMPYSETRKQEIGILGTNSEGCLRSNLDFFDDFVRNGRTLGRANLFVYTLPSIPFAEAAIHFRCQGPLLYAAFPSEPLASLLRQADAMILRGEAEAMLAVRATEEDAQCFALGRPGDAPGGPVLTLDEAIELAKRAPSAPEMIEALESPQGEGGARRAPGEDPSGGKEP
jgi:hypothetical protein